MKSMLTITSNSEVEVVWTLLDARTDMKAQGGEHEAALLDALENNHEMVVQILLGASAKVYVEGEYAVAHCRRHQTEIMRR